MKSLKEKMIGINDFVFLFEKSKKLYRILNLVFQIFKSSNGYIGKNHSEYMRIRFKIGFVKKISQETYCLTRVMNRERYDLREV